MSIKLLFLLFCFAFIVIKSNAQTLPIIYNTNYWNDTLGMQNAVSANSIFHISKLIQKHKPSITNKENREIAFALYDQLMNNPNAAKLKAVQQFYERQMSTVLKNLEKKTSENEILIYKLYNHGFIVKSSTVTAAFDFVRGTCVPVTAFAINDSLTKAIIKKIDVFFVSHWHPDHADEWIAEEAIRQQKIVIAPDSIWLDKPFYNLVYHPKRSLKEASKLMLPNNHEIIFTALPGHQTSTKTKLSVTNNMYLVSLDGKTIAHTGDQYNIDDLTWIDSIKLFHKVDILLPNCWSMELPRLIKGFNPMVIIPGHENELSHTIDHREPYFLSQVRLGSYYSKSINLFFGEIYKHNF